MMEVKRYLLISVLIIFFLCMLPSKNGYAAKKIKLNKQSLSLEVGEKYILKLRGFSGNIVWSSSDNNIAVVEQGQVTALHPGKCIITASTNKKAYRCKITVKYLKENNKTNCFSTMSENYSFDLSPCETFEGVFSDDEMGEYQICFKADIKSFDDIKIGKGIGAYRSTYVIISKDKLKIVNSETDEILKEYDLSFQIQNFVSVIIQSNYNGKAIIQINSAGNQEEFKVNWSARNGKLFVISGKEALLYNCKLSYYCNGWNKPIWLFGDSYFSSTSADRWTYYLLSSNNLNFLLNGYSGRNSNSALESLKTMLNYNIPKEIIWCMGMNDGDSESLVNPNWQNTIYELMDICERYDIDLVLSTIPNCPTVNNKYKNEYIRESGYKYIDFSKAVGSDWSVNWYDGLLEGGDAPCHPTEKGALVLYAEAVVTCPELLH